MKLYPPFVIDSPEQLLKRKQIFAKKLLLNPGDPFAATLQVIPDTGAALHAAEKWPADMDVIDFQQALIAKFGKSAFLPDQDDTARLAHEMATGKQPVSNERINALKLYSEIRGWVGRALTINNNNQNNVALINRVMLVKDHGTDAEWEAKARKQQSRLKREVIENVSG